MVLYPLIAWELSSLAGLALARWKNKKLLILPVMILSGLVIKVSLQDLPGWEFAAQQAQHQVSSLEKNTEELKNDQADVPFAHTSAAPWYADRPAVWDPGNEKTRISIREKLSQ